VLHALLTAAASNALTATALAVPAALASRRCRPAVAHGLWLLVLLKLVTPPLLPLAVPWPSAAGPPREERSPIAAAPAPPAAVEAPVAPAEGRPATVGPVVISESPSAPAAPAVAPTPPAPSAPEAPPRRLPWEEALAAAWVAGSLAWWAAAGLRLARFHRALRALHPAPEEVQAQARRLAGRLGLRRCPGVWFVPAPVSPMLLALGRSPRLLLPAALWGRLDEGQRDALLAHELAHLRRRDHWARRLELVVLGLYWWHPVAWWARRRLQEAEEECCDAWVVWALPGLAPAYAAALVETVAFVSQTRPALPAGASGAGQVPLLKRRLTMILRGPGPRSLSRPGLLALLGLGVLLLPLAPTGARPAPPGPDAKPAPRVAEWHRGEPHRGIDLKNADTQMCLRCHALPDKEWEWVRKQPDAWTKAHAEVIQLLQEVQTSRANLQKAEARLREALDRMDAVMRKADPHGKPAPAEGGKPAAAPSDQRLKDLEKKLDRLLDEVDALRREVRPKKSGAGPAVAPRGREVSYVNKRAFQLPIKVERAAGVREVLLYVSRDQGQTWEAAAKASPTDPSFSYVAPADGEYWFLVQTSGPDGRLSPASVSGAGPNLQVCVDTEAPAVSLRGNEWPQEGEAAVLWDVRDKNLDLSTLRVEYRLQKETEWRPLAVRQAARTIHQWRPAAPGPLEVRLRVRDLAGNAAEATTTLTTKAPAAGQ
jgi:beta-lactamase regulating signal transducer with metallopeptidase domain